MGPPIEDPPADQITGASNTQTTQASDLLPCWSEQGKSFPKSLIRAVEISSANGFKFRLECGSLRTVGRGRGVDVQILSDGMLSRNHMSFECNAEHVVVRDLGSTNGTFVNGQRVQSARLCNGDQIIAGLTVFIVKVEYVAS